ncbi:serine protease HTRA3-like isoform X2 [Portunus trituberculatus]|uniref:serine protease HTRA3-like isoform X2 n=1 Tax=Portunus trituberculatus TaxID=210409 RepID=UPI001E1D0144|nr:serine protease HTRA3-like isoform X2 [Portunus trituberculatus]
MAASPIVRWIMAGLLTLSLFTVTAAVSALKPDALQCGACDPSRCPAIGECHRGITWDVCNCCEVCSKDINEECGGPWEAYGKCGIGLTCLRDARECPYLFNPRGTASDTGSNICDEYLFNAIGRCVQNEQMMHSPHSPFKGNLVKKILEGNRQEMEQENDLTESMVGKRLMLKGVLRGVEY